MLGRLWRWVLAGFRGREDPEDDGGRFVPSPLDYSVRVAHGGRDDEIDRELSRIHREAEHYEGVDAESR